MKYVKEEAQDIIGLEGCRNPKNSVNWDPWGFFHESDESIDTPKECFVANFEDIEVIEIFNHKKINGRTYYLLPTICV